MRINFGYDRYYVKPRPPRPEQIKIPPVAIDCHPLPVATTILVDPVFLPHRQASERNARAVSKGDSLYSVHCYLERIALAYGAVMCILHLICIVMCL